MDILSTNDGNNMNSNLDWRLKEFYTMERNASSTMRMLGQFSEKQTCIVAIAVLRYFGIRYFVGEEGEGRVLAKDYPSRE